MQHNCPNKQILVVLNHFFSIAYDDTDVKGE